MKRSYLHPISLHDKASRSLGKVAQCHVDPLALTQQFSIILGSQWEWALGPTDAEGALDKVTGWLTCSRHANTMLA